MKKNEWKKNFTAGTLRISFETLVDAIFVKTVIAFRQ